MTSPWDRFPQRVGRVTLGSRSWTATGELGCVPGVVHPRGDCRADTPTIAKQTTTELMHLASPIKASRRRGLAGRAALGVVELDRSVPVLMMRIGRYPLHHGTVGAIRSLGRLGVPVYTVVEDHITPAACSRYLTGSFRWPTSGREEPEELVQGLLRIGGSIGGRPILAATDEEAAILIAEQAPDSANASYCPPSTPASRGGWPRNTTCIRCVWSTGFPRPCRGSLGRAKR